MPDINALASAGDRSASVMIWNYHDLNTTSPVAAVDVRIKGFTAKQVLLHHYRIDNEFSNSYETWKKMGSPQNPDAGQISRLQKAGMLQTIGKADKLRANRGKTNLNMLLPRQGVSLLKFDW